MVVQVRAPVAARVALVAGATGLVGREILAALLTDKHYAAVHCVGRRALTLNHPKLLSHVVDFSKPDMLTDISHVDDVFIALGTTIKVAGSQAAFRAVDFEAVVTLARAAKAAGASKLGVVSAMGASPGSPVFYNRVKGEMEQALTQLGFKLLVIARPSMLDGERAALAQPARRGEQLGLIAMKLLQPLIPANYQPIAAERVARSLVKAIQENDHGSHVLLSGQLQGAA